MRALILAAGRGSRMRHLTDDRPKCLVELHGRTLLDRQLAALREGGVREIGIVTGYRREMLAGRGLAEFHNPRWEQTNMVSSLACAQEWLHDGPCLVSYSDIYYAASAVRSLLDCAAPLAITYDPAWEALWRRRFGDPLRDAETFRLAPDGTLVEIGQRPRTVAEVQGQYMGLLRFTPQGWDEAARIREAMAPEACDRLDMTGLLGRIIAAGRLPVAAVPYAGEWGEVDSGEDLRLYADGTPGA